VLARHDGDPARRRSDGAGDVSSVLRLLDRLYGAAAATGRAGSVLEIRMLQAVAHHVHGDVSRALTVLGQAVAESPEPDSYVRLYLDEGRPMLALLREAGNPASAERTRDEWGAPLWRHARRLLALLDTPAATAPGQASLAEPPPAQSSLAEPLSQRELQVLALLDTELTGPEIARELYVSLNTLRTHTKHIFTKLDVSTRAAAVRRARERGLL
jgi:LuxR family maltose regulon positive regulatory protein